MIFEERDGSEEHEGWDERDDSEGREGWEERDRSIAIVDGANERASRAHRDMLAGIAQMDRTGAWKGSGARDIAHWLAMRYGISTWKAHRWVHAAHAIEGLPRLSEALASGELGLDTTVELARFATPSTETALVTWATEVSCGAVRHRGDVAVRRERQGGGRGAGPLGLLVAL